MSLKTETFYAIQCEFPGCGLLWDNGEYTYYTDPYDDTEGMRDLGWCVGTPLGDYCPDHADRVDCTPDAEGICTVCGEHEDEGGWHNEPIPATPEGHLRVMLKRIEYDIEQAGDRLLFRVDRELGTGYMGGPGTLRGRTEQALNGIHRRACVSIHPELTDRQIAKMQENAT